MKFKKIKQICYKSSFIRSSYIYKIIDSGILDKQIKHIKYEKIQTTMYQSFKKGTTNTYSLFVLNLDKFLMFLDIHFIINPTEKFIVLKNIFDSERSKLFLSVKDINDERDWYIFEYKKLIIEKFYNTLNCVYKNNEDAKKQLDKVIDFNKFSIKNDKDIEKIFKFLKDIINCSRENIQYLFYDYNVLVKNEIYLEMYFEIFDNYKQRKDYLKYLGL